jgi:hypothetical protein
MKPYADLLRLIAEGQSNTKVRIKPAVRGQDYGPFTIRIQGDFTTATLVGAINGRPNDSAPICTFTIGSPTFSDGVTTFEYSLAGADTALFPATQSGADEFLFDFLLDNVALFGGVLPVRGFITEATP